MRTRQQGRIRNGGLRLQEGTTVHDGADDGTRAWIMEEGHLVTRNKVRNAFKRVEWMTDLVLPDRVHQPSRILLQSLCIRGYVFREESGWPSTRTFFVGVERRKRQRKIRRAN
jgi:hypothetical protein